VTHQLSISPSLGFGNFLPEDLEDRRSDNQAYIGKLLADSKKPLLL